MANRELIEAVVYLLAGGFIGCCIVNIAYIMAVSSAKKTARKSKETTHD